MNIKDIKELRIGDLLAKLPIIQGGMGVRISLANLAAAVANEGGIGVIATAGIGFEELDNGNDFLGASIRALKREIKKAKELTKGIIGVNIMGALTNYADMINTCIEEKVDIIFSGAGLPLHLPGFLKKDTKTKLVPIVSSARAASIITKSWTEKYDYPPDAVVVEGPMAGGHLGFKEEQINDIDFILEKIIPEVIEALKPFEKKYNKLIPVIAAGGIYTGKDIHKFFQLGASGVQLGTRFVPTFECDASMEFKQTYIDSSEEDIVIIKSPVGMPGRAIKNKFLKAVENGKKQPFKCPYHCIKTCDYTAAPYCIALALTNAYKGNLEHGFAFAGENAFRTKGIISVKELMDSLVKEYKEAAMNSKGNDSDAKS
ncbi:MAG TPA: nitronate monooxygenase family protein [Ignavibacteria bacterium]